MPRRVRKGETCSGGLVGSGKVSLAINALLVKRGYCLTYLKFGKNGDSTNRKFGKNRDLTNRIFIQ